MNGLSIPQNLLGGQPAPDMIDPSMLGGQPLPPPPVFNEPIAPIPGLEGAPQGLPQGLPQDAQMPMPSNLNEIPVGMAEDAANKQFGPTSGYKVEVQADNTLAVRRLNPDGSNGPIIKIVKL
jgi:hypothetical protein